MLPILYVVQVTSLPCFSHLGAAMGSGSSSVRFGNWKTESPEDFNLSLVWPSWLNPAVSSRWYRKLLSPDFWLWPKQEVDIALCIDFFMMMSFSLLGDSDEPWGEAEPSLLREDSALRIALQSWRIDTEQESKEHRINHQLLSAISLFLDLSYLR